MLESDMSVPRTDSGSSAHWDLGQVTCLRLNLLICKLDLPHRMVVKVKQENTPGGCPTPSSTEESSRCSVISSSPYNQIPQDVTVEENPAQSCSQPYLSLLFIHVSTEQILPEHLLCARRCARSADIAAVVPELMKLYCLAGRIKQTCLPTCFESCRNKAHRLSAAIWNN